MRFQFVHPTLGIGQKSILCRSSTNKWRYGRFGCFLGYLAHTSLIWRFLSSWILSTSSSAVGSTGSHLLCSGSRPETSDKVDDHSFYQPLALRKVVVVIVMNTLTHRDGISITRKLISQKRNTIKIDFQNGKLPSPCGTQITYLLFSTIPFSIVFIFISKLGYLIRIPFL